jgi:hypothetical protein
VARYPQAGQQGCKLYGRLNLFVEGQGDELGSFIFRTTDYSSVRTLAARLKYLEAVSGGHTRYLPLTLRLRAKSTTQSYRTPVYYVDLTLWEETNLTEAVRQAWLLTRWSELLRNGQCEDIDEEVLMLLEEFYPQANTEETANGSNATGVTTSLNARQGHATSTEQKPQPRMVHRSWQAQPLNHETLP